MNKMFPAIELVGEMVIELVPNIDPKKDQVRFEKGEINLRTFKQFEQLRQLGFGLIIIESGPQKGVYIFLPDRDALLTRWEKLREKNPKLPPLDILSSEGIADDITFLLAFFTHHVVLSTGKEFVHDQLVHVIPILLELLESQDKPTYQKEKGRLIKLIAASYRRILVAKRMIEEGKVKNISQVELDLVLKHINTMIRVLGAFVDQVTASPGAMSSFDKKFLEAQFQNIWEDPQWARVVNVKAEPVETLKTVWEQMTEIEKEFDKLHPKSR